MNDSKHQDACYAQIQAIAQDANWLALANRHDVDLEIKTHLGKVLHCQGEPMNCIEPFINVKTNQQTTM